MLPESTRANWGWGLAKHAGQLLVKLMITMLLGGLLGASLVKFAPGFNSDEENLDARLSPESKQALQAARASENNIARYYLHYLLALVHGELGTSRSLARPVTELLKERLPVTIKCVASGWAMGWCLGFALAVSAVTLQSQAYDALASVLIGSLLCFPIAVISLMFMYVGGPAWLVIGLIVFPNVFRYSRNLLASSNAQLHVLTARAKGAGRMRVFIWHILPTSAPQLLALGGVTMSVALGAAIPIEAIFDLPGTGQLAWQSALARDLPVLVSLTLLMTGFTLLVNLVAELFAMPFKAATQ